MMVEKHYYNWDEESRICVGYKRIGECNKCGECCKAHIVYRVAGEVAMQDRKNGGDKKTKGVGIWTEINEEDKRTFFSTTKIELGEATPCSNLDENNLCEGYDEKKAICADWPFNPSDLKYFPRCGYSFEKHGSWSYEEIGEK